MKPLTKYTSDYLIDMTDLHSKDFLLFKIINVHIMRQYIQAKCTSFIVKKIFWYCRK